MLLRMKFIRAVNTRKVDYVGRRGRTPLLFEASYLLRTIKLGPSKFPQSALPPFRSIIKE